MEKFTSEDYPSIVQDLAKDLSKVLDKIGDGDGDEDVRKKFVDDMTEHLISLNDRTNRTELGGRTISREKAYQEAHFAASYVLYGYRQKEWFHRCHKALNKLDQKN